MRESIYEKTVELRQELHNHPELSMEEVGTKRRLMEFLKVNAPGVEVVDRGRWFYGVYRSDNPEAKNIAFRTEIDALPAGHKCGHDGHMASMAGFACEVSECGADNNIYFVFQHAEEIGGGGEECAELMDEVGMNEVYGAHNSSDFEKDLVVVKPGTSKCASEGLEIIFTGVSAHASQPEHGKNPALAVCNIVTELSEIADPAKYRGLVLCTVIQMDVGERAFGVAAHKGKLLLTLRGQFEDEMKAIEEAVIALAKSQAEAYGLEVAFEYHDVFPETKSWPEATKKVEEACAKAGLKFYERPDFQRASEDFGYFTKKTPGAYIWIGNGTEHPPIHSIDFDFIDSHIQVFSRLFGALAGIRK